MGYDMRASRHVRQTWVRRIISRTERWVVGGHASLQMCMNVSGGNRDIGAFSFSVEEARRAVSASVSLSLSRSSVSWNMELVRWYPLEWFSGARTMFRRSFG